MFLVFEGVAISFISGSTSATYVYSSYPRCTIVIFSVLSVFPSRKKNFYAHSSFGRRRIIFLGGLDLLRGLINGNLF